MLRKLLIDQYKISQSPLEKKLYRMTSFKGNDQLLCWFSALNWNVFIQCIYSSYIQLEQNIWAIWGKTTWISGKSGNNKTNGRGWWRGRERPEWAGFIFKNCKWSIWRRFLKTNHLGMPWFILPITIILKPITWFFGQFYNHNNPTSYLSYAVVPMQS